MHILTKSTEKGKANICLGYICEELLIESKFCLFSMQILKKFQCKGKELIKSLNILPLSY